MTTIYTKPQIDAMAVKIGIKIKEAKTTVTQSQGQSTTYAVSQKMITDSLSAFGTAAYKNVGTAAGNVMEVGAFGLGGMSFIAANTPLADQAIIGLGSKLINGGILPPDVPPTAREIGKVVFIGDPEWGTQLWFSYYYGRAFFRNKQTGMDYESWKEFYHSGTSNLQSDSIQAGIGAPKIAYKKLTGTALSPETQIAHGLNPEKILNVSATVLGTDGAYYMSEYTEGAKKYSLLLVGQDIVVRTAVGASVVKDRPIKILITYEVD